jgi:hypothetical protein
VDLERIAMRARHLVGAHRVDRTDNGRRIARQDPQGRTAPSILLCKATGKWLIGLQF